MSIRGKVYLDPELSVCVQLVLDRDGIVEIAAVLDRALSTLQPEVYPDAWELCYKLDAVVRDYLS